MVAWTALVALGLYLAFVTGLLGLHQRIPLALGAISLDRIPDRAARRYGDRPLFTTDRPCRWSVPALRERYPDPCAWSARRIAETSAWTARLLRDRCGVDYPDRVAILKENHLDIHVLIAAIVRAGGIAAPINDRFAAHRLEAYLANVGARVLITDPASVLALARDGAGFGPTRLLLLAGRASDHDAGTIERIRANVGPEREVLWLEDELSTVSGPLPAPRRGPTEPLYLVHSSGTTGFPKAVTLRNGAQSHAVRGWLCYVHVARGIDRGYMAVPNNHQAVILTFNSGLLLGIPGHWTAAYHRDFDAGRTVRELEAGRFTGFFGFPIAYTRLKEHPVAADALRHMRFWGSTADASHAVMQKHVVRRGSVFRRLGIPIDGSVFLDAQGSSEVGTPSVIRYVTRFTRRFDRRIGRPGSTPFGPAIRVVGEDGRAVRRGDVGRLEVRGRTVFAGYWNNDALTVEYVRDGWFFTGDLVRRGRDGHLRQLDRAVDVIRTSEGPVYSLPIEESVLEHPAVFDVCVYGERRPDGFQLVVAAIAPRPGHSLSPEALREELNAVLPARSRVQRVDLVPWDEFPMGPTGKTLKREFRARSEPVSDEPNQPLAPV